MARTANEILDDIRSVRARNRAIYTTLSPDKTMDLIAKLYSLNPQKAQEWHRLILANDEKILELTRELCALDV